MSVVQIRSEEQPVPVPVAAKLGKTRTQPDLRPLLPRVPPFATHRNIPGGIKNPGPIALTNSNTSWRSSSGHLGETLTFIWDITPPSMGPSANSSVLPLLLEGLSSCSILLNALKPLASLLEGSAIPEVVHADPPVMGGVPEFYLASPPKTPKAETPHANASQLCTSMFTSAAATSPKPMGTP